VSFLSTFFIAFHGDLQAATVPQGGRFGTPVVPAIRFDASTVMAETIIVTNSPGASYAGKWMMTE
jgi:hypothetical protein